MCFFFKFKHSFHKEYSLFGVTPLKRNFSLFCRFAMRVLITLLFLGLFAVAFTTGKPTENASGENSASADVSESSQGSAGSGSEGEPVEPSVAGAEDPEEQEPVEQPGSTSGNAGAKYTGLDRANEVRSCNANKEKAKVQICVYVSPDDERIPALLAILNDAGESDEPVEPGVERATGTEQDSAVQEETGSNNIDSNEKVASAGSEDSAGSEEDDSQSEDSNDSEVSR